MDAAKKIILALWLVVMTVANASALAHVAPENRAWKNFGSTPETRLAEAAQPVQTHQENTGWAYENALGCCLAAKTPLALPAPRQIAAEWSVNTYRHGGQMSAIEHINYRHGFNSGFKDVSRFAEGTSARQIQGYVDDALRYGRVTPNGVDGFQIEHTFGKAIGTDQAGNAASGIRIFVRDGNIQTAFPIP